MHTYCKHSSQLHPKHSVSLVMMHPLHIYLCSYLSIETENCKHNFRIFKEKHMLKLEKNNFNVFGVSHVSAEGLETLFSETF